MRAALRHRPSLRRLACWAALGLAAASGCRRPPQGGQDAAARPPAPDRPLTVFEAAERTPPPPTTTRCDDMTMLQCMRARHCVLEPPARVDGGAAGGPYVCRDARPPCEGGVAQLEPGFRANCAARPGCSYIPARCYCFGQTRVRVTGVLFPNCTCGGGPVNLCLPASLGDPYAPPAPAPSAAPPDAAVPLRRAPPGDGG